MNERSPKAIERGAFHGAFQIIRFNWPRYVAAAIVIIVGLLALRIARLPQGIACMTSAAILITTWWSIASVIASYWVYDRSELMSWNWLNRELPRVPRRWLNIHAGLDESSAALHTLWPNSNGQTVDIFTANQMTEGSIHRARVETDSIHASHKALPFGAHDFDSIFLFFVAHELRTPETRQELFREVNRVLAPEGSAVLVEHLRDLPNFAAYGPGFTHFHSLRTWRADLAAAALAIDREFSLTPFVRVFFLRRQL